MELNSQFKYLNNDRKGSKKQKIEQTIFGAPLYEFTIGLECCLATKIVAFQNERRTNDQDLFEVSSTVDNNFECSPEERAKIDCYNLFNGPLLITTARPSYLKLEELRCFWQDTSQPPPKTHRRMGKGANKQQPPTRHKQLISQMDGGEEFARASKHEKNDASSEWKRLLKNWQ